ncbi:hypothetical protein [Erythrobacter sp.]|uniref:hypothetical protein n=1 Tax=Erythrobacter sp. TaxID=1042 RepID=UPI002EAC4246|nr:hypothetical protein [Erythrobacter sp.]
MEKLDAANALQTVTILNRTISVATLRAELVGTAFTVTDRTNFNNRGVGSAEFVPIGQNNDFINYGSIIGDGQGSDYYGDSSYVDNSGMHALVLHELGHMNQIAHDFWELRVDVQRLDPTSSGDFYSSEYGANNEAFAEEMGQQMASLIGLNLYSASTGNHPTPRDPKDIYRSNTGQPYPN